MGKRSCPPHHWVIEREERPLPDKSGFRQRGYLYQRVISWMRCRKCGTTRRQEGREPLAGVGWEEVREAGLPPVDADGQLG